MQGRMAGRRCVLAILAMAVGTQAPAQQPPRLSLQQALTRAEQQNLDLAAARARRAFASAGVQVARQRPNPVFSFSASRDAPHEGVNARPAIGAWPETPASY